jgi:hypothetical protein
LVVPITDESPSVQQQMIDAAGSVLASNIPNDYYSRCWTIIGILTLNGAIQSAGMKLASQSPSIQTTGIPCCSNNLKDVSGQIYQMNLLIIQWRLNLIFLISVHLLGM